MQTSYPNSRRRRSPSCRWTAVDTPSTSSMEFPDLGQNCAKADCKQLDFLPATCLHCNSIFCSDHLSPFVHDCAQFKNNVLSDSELEARERERWQVKCSQSGCKVKDLLPMKCLHCDLHFCLAHRHADQHGLVND